MGLLDTYYQFVDGECEKLMGENDALKSLLDSTGLGSLGSFMLDSVNDSYLTSIQNSPLYDLAEDWLAEQISNNVNNIVNTMTGQIEKQVGGALTSIRDVAFSSITAILAMQQELAYYFAMKTAESCVNVIDLNVDVLTKLRDAVRRLYNALVALSETGEFMKEYIEKLREAIRELVQAYNKLQRVRSGFSSTSQFQINLYTETKTHVENAGKLILPEPKKPDLTTRLSLVKPYTELGRKAKANSFLPSQLGIQTESARQYLALQAMWQIPKLTWEMLDKYNKTSVNMLKINSLITGFTTIDQASAGMPDFLKKYIIGSLDKSMEECLGIIKDMAKRINGDETYFEEPLETDTGPFNPTPTDVCARTPVWGLRVKGLQVLLGMIDTKSLEALEDSNELKKIHDDAVEELSKLGDIKGSRIVLRRTEGKEQLGQLEPLLLKLASNSVLAIFDKTKVAKNSRGQYKEDTVIVLAQTVMEYIDLSLRSQAEIKAILESYINKTRPRLKALENLGNSVLALCDEFGLDKLKDTLTENYSKVTSFLSKYSTYVGAALMALYTIRGLLTDSASQKCLDEVINDTKTKERAKQLESSRSSTSNIKKQIAQNKETCAELRRKKKKIEQCVGGKLGLLADEPPGISDKLLSMFKGILGDDMAPTGVSPTPAPEFSTPGMAPSSVDTFANLA